MEPTIWLSESTVYHVVTTEDATAGISSMALGVALSGHLLGERHGESTTRAHMLPILKNRHTEVIGQERGKWFASWQIRNGAQKDPVADSQV